MPDESRQYRLSPLAEADLEDIWLYTFKHWSLEQADRYHHDLIDAIEALARGVKTGRRTDVREGYFKYPVASISFSSVNPKPPWMLSASCTNEWTLNDICDASRCIHCRTSVQID
jgi:toxin ParE1/3/4